MRSTRLLLVASAFAFAGAATGCTETGAHLTLRAPNGPSNAKTFEVVLASHDDAPAIADQRVAPDDSATQTVHYFKQRTVAGSDNDRIDELDGLTLRIAPDGAVDASQFIPFVLLYDGDKRLVAIATYRMQDTGMPAPILVKTDEIDTYQVEVEAVTQVTDDKVGLENGEVRVVRCPRDGDDPITSGIVWRSAVGIEHRIVLPVDGGLDATARELDLDCDGHAVRAETSASDCDDTRAWFHDGAPEACDGFDTDCDSASVTTVDCQTAVACTDPFTNTQGGGKAICDDSTGIAATCQPTAACACANAVAGTGCYYCKMRYEGTQTNVAGNVHPCQPATGLFYTRFCGDAERCESVEVTGVRGGWTVELAHPNTTTFASQLTNVGGAILVRASRSEGPGYELQGQASAPLADIDLVFTTADGTRYLGLQLRLESGTSDACGADGSAEMICN